MGGPRRCSLARNFLMHYPDDPEAGVECIACPECPLGLGLVPQCGTKITNYTTIKCEPCQQNETYSDKHGSESCRSCHDCGLRNVIQQCTPSQNRKCGTKCPERHFLNDNGFCQECYFCCSGVDKTRRLEKCKEIGMGEDWQCHKNHENKLCKEALEHSTEAGVVTTHAIRTGRLLPGHNFAANQTDSTSSDNFRKLMSSSENITWKGKIAVGIIILITLVLIFPIVYGVKKLITSRNSSAVQSEVVGSPEHVPLCLIRREERDDNGGTVQDNRADEQEQSSVRQTMNNRPNIGLIPTDCKISEMFDLSNNNKLMLHDVQRMLDPVETSTEKNWRGVGQILKVTDEDLKLMHLQYLANGSPTESLLGTLKTFTPEPSMKEFVEALISCGRNDVARYICNWPWERRNCTEPEQPA